VDADDPVRHYAWIFGAAIAGAISAQPVMRWKEMNWAERILTVFVGSTFAVFLTPLIASRVLRIDDHDLQTVCALTYLAGTIGNAVVPILIARGKDWAATWGGKKASNKRSRP
jgi:hypothetical protein